MSLIRDIQSREILDSRGNPTLAVTVSLSSGVSGTASVPSGASTGSKEALERRDGDPKRYHGKGVLQACRSINGAIREALLGQDPAQQEQIDNRLLELDGTENKSKLGANAILGVSLAALYAAAQDAQAPLYRYLGGDDAYLMPVPLMNIVNGGAHANNHLDIQEFMIAPVGASCFSDALRYGAEVFYVLKNNLVKANLSVAVGDEGGFAPNFPDNQTAIEWILTAIEQAGYVPGEDIALALDVASSEWHYPDKGYFLASENRYYTAAEWIDCLERWVDRYPIVSIEDGLGESDQAGWALLTSRLEIRFS